MLRAGQRLLARRGSIGVVHIEDKGGGGLGIARDNVVHQGAGETREVVAVHVVL